MGKLHMKRTPAEQVEHERRKARRAARKAAKHARRRASTSEDDSVGPSSHKRPRTEDISDEESPSHRAQKPDYDYIRAQVEEERFREKMWGAFGDDERLDSVEASLNSYAHIPRRWRGGGMDRMDDELDIDPQMMEDEDYAEWVRDGMWKRKHADEYAEQERKKAERAARHARKQAARDETKRIEKEEEERLRRHRTERNFKRLENARTAYEARWTELAIIQPPQRELRFEDIPWPVLATDVGPTPKSKGKGKERAVEVSMEDITAEAIAVFLLDSAIADPAADAEAVQKARRDKLRATMLRFHPDKFEGRIMPNIRESHRERVREALGRVTRAITDLLADKGR